MKINSLNAKKFINNLYCGNGSFKFSNESDVINLYSTCFAIMSLDLIDELKKYSNIEKKKMIAYLLNFQNERNGLFIDATCIPKQKSFHDFEYIQLQMTDFVQMALMALNAEPKYGYTFLVKYKDKKYLEKWLCDLNWEDPWLVSNIIMFILNSLIYEQDFFNANNKQFIDYIIAWLNKTQDAKNGYWNLGRKVTFHNQMAGAYHFLFFYTYLNKKPNYIKKIIDSTINIQDYDGLFSYSGGGGSCEDLDAIDLLCRSTFYNANYKKNRIKKILKKSYKNLIFNQNSNGGFCWAKRNNLCLKKIFFSVNFKLLFYCGIQDFLNNFLQKVKNQIMVIFFKKKLTWKYSDIETMKIKLNDSDIWSTWFRLLAIAFIEETFPIINDNKKSFNWNMRTKCGLGFYKKNEK